MYCQMKMIGKKEYIKISNIIFFLFLILKLNQ